MFSAVCERASDNVTMSDPHILLVVQDQAARYDLAATLLDAGFRLTLASSAGVASALVDGEIDLVVAAHPFSDLSDARLSRRCGAGDPQVPMLLLEQETVSGPGVLDLVTQSIRRWPVGHAHAA